VFQVAAFVRVGEARRGLVQKTDLEAMRASKFGWLWAAYAISTVGTWIAFDALTLVAILLLHAGPTEVSIMAAAGPAVGALIAIPLGPWIEFRRKRPVMIAMDLVRFAALASIPAALAIGWLSFAQLLAVSVVVGGANIVFRAASGAFLKGLVPAQELLIANARFESTTWTATAIGPPLGGAAIGIFGPVATVVADAFSYVCSAAAIAAIGGSEPQPPRVGAAVLRAGELLEGWRYILGHPTLRPLFFNTVLVGGLIMATAPLLAVLMLGDLGFSPWQYGLAFGAPCIGGLVGARLAGVLAVRFGRHKVMRAAGALRACWSVGLAFVFSGSGGLALVIAVQFGLVTCMGVFNPMLATYRLEQTPADRVARTLAAWSVTSGATIAGMTALWGVLAAIIGPRVAIAVAGVLMLATPLLLPRRDDALEPDREPTQPARLLAPADG
jgi:MFS family permease